MKRIVLLDYTFMFDPSALWPSLSQFESSLIEYYAAHGCEVSIVETGGNTGRRVLQINKIEDIPRLVNQPQQTKGTSGQVIRNMAQSTPSEQQQRFQKGRFLKTKGYLKR